MEVICSSAHLRADTSTKFMKNLEEKKIELLNELLHTPYWLAWTEPNLWREKKKGQNSLWNITEALIKFKELANPV